MAQSLEHLTPEEIAQMAQTYQAALENPDTRETMLRVTKKLNPGISIPEVDLKDQARAAFGESKKEMDELKNEIRARDARDRIERERSDLREQGYNKDDVAAIEKIMMDEHIPNYKTAAKYYANARQVAEPTPSSGAQPGSTYDLPADALAAGKGGKPGLTKFARQQADAAMTEILSGRVKLH